ncbi:MAG TPA: sulfate adenylyltransferase, partial [Dehalococcoidia bacterium]|nr:sulfate adenylyltransferase [Dehalococcoidia bacterium]
MDREVMKPVESIAPHGGKLVSRIAPAEEREHLPQRLQGLPTLRLSARAVADLDLIAVGAYSPLEGFMGQEDYQSVLKEMRLASGLPWSVPITLAVEKQEVRGLREGQEVVLQDEAGQALAVLHLEECFGYDKEEEAERVYRTTEAAHPGVAALYRQGDVLLGGRITLQ